MKRAIFLFTAFVTAVFAENDRPETTQAIYSLQPNLFYFGPSVSCMPKNSFNREYWGIRLGCEYFKPWSYYCGFDFESGCPGGNNPWNYSLNTRLGYTFATENLMLTPFVGTILFGPHYAGVYKYVSGGLRSLITVYSRTDFGVNLTIFTPLNHRFLSFEEIALPINFHPTNHCDVRFEPYFMDTLDNQWPGFGSRFLIGYRY